MKLNRKTILISLALFLAAGVGLIAQGSADEGPITATAVRSDLSIPLRDMKPGPVVPVPAKQIPNVVKFAPPFPGEDIGADPLTQSSAAPFSPFATTPAPTLSFDGTSDDDNAAFAGGRVVPPDTEGDVGPNHYVQMNNLVFEIFDKSGNTVLGPLANNTLWSGFGGICQTNNNGDPIVFHDQLADRWVFSQFAIGSTGHQCFAVSQTSDPTGPYHRYDFEISPGLNGFNDYPKIGMWPDGYYLTANEFGGPSQSFQFPIAVAFERDAMLVGDPGAQFVRFNVPDSGGTTFFSLQPSHWEGAAAPPSGAPNVFAMALDTATWGGAGSDGYQLWEFDVNWASPASSTFTSLGRVATTNFDANLCNFAQCAPQPSPGELLDTLSQFTMFRLMYRNLNGIEVLLVNHTVDVGSNRAGVRWAELRKNGGSWVLHQTGTYAPADGVHRWMGSIAMDGDGNIAVSYSASSTSLNPAVRYNTRMAADAAGTLPGGEVDCVAGGGVQTGSFNRWGDYSSISVDPTDDCTFWLTNEYYANSGSFDFKTRICSFTLPGCGGGPGNTPPTVTITAPADGSSFNEGESIGFAGTANDAEDGDISANLSWTSSLDGSIGSGAAFSTTLSVGTHTITASVTDSGGLPGSDQITVTVNSNNTPPTVTITSPADGSSFDEGVSISFAGTAIDAEDGDISANLSWTSSLDDSIGSGAAFSTTLSMGTHTITASVTDSGGLPGSDQITVTVNAVGGPPAAPSNLSASGGASGSRNDRNFFVSLAWTDNSGNEDTFRIERTVETGRGRNKSCGAFVEVASVGADVTSYQDNGLNSKTTYCYRVRARNGNGDSAYSNEATAKTPNK